MSGENLFYRENAWIVCALTPLHYKEANWFSVTETVQFLGVPSTVLTGPFFEHLGTTAGKGVIDIFHDVHDAGPAMKKLRDLVIEESIPRFQKMGSVDGFLKAMNDMYTRSPRSYLYAEAICYLEIIRGNMGRAREVGYQAARLVEGDRGPHAQMLGARVAEIIGLAERNHRSAVDRLARWADETWLAVSRN